MSRHRFCTTSNRDAFIEELAEQIWDERRISGDEPSWADADPEAQQGFAEAGSRHVAHPRPRLTFCTMMPDCPCNSKIWPHISITVQQRKGGGRMSHCLKPLAASLMDATPAAGDIRA
jgi:hypothetical protein